jgi:hypothetical protein
MEKELYDLKIDEILSQCKNGYKRFDSSPLFRSAVIMLAKGKNPITLIDILIEIQDELGEQYVEYVQRNPPQMLMYPNADKI